MASNAAINICIYSTDVVKLLNATDEEVVGFHLFNCTETPRFVSKYT